MNVATIALRNVTRNKFRTTLTVIGVAVAIVAFVMLRTVVAASSIAVDFAAKDRVASRHKVSFVMSLPRHYIDTLRSIRGVRAATWANWVGAKDPRDPDNFFATLAVDPASFLVVYDEVSVPAAQREAFVHDRQGALIGDVLARKLGVKVGDRITLEGTIYPGTFTYNVSGIYVATRKSFDRSTFLVHWDYMNESLPEARRDQIGWMIARIDEPRHAADISQLIDRTFENEDAQTLSMSERAMNLSFMGMFSAVLSALDVVSIILLGILLMILGNTVAMGVRERTNEYGVLRAMGFLPRHVVLFIVTESILTGALAGALGLAVSYPFVQLGIGRWLEENMGGMFPYFRIDPTSAAAAFGFALMLGAIAAVLPAWRASRLTVTDALRRQD